MTSWNRVCKGGHRLVYAADRKFHRHQGEYAGHFFNPQGELIDQEQFEANQDTWIASDEDRAYVKSLMVQVTKPGEFAHWIAPPKRGINGNPIEFEYVKFTQHVRD